MNVNKEKEKLQYVAHYCADDPAVNRLSSSSLLSVAEENMSTLSFAGANLTGRKEGDIDFFQVKSTLRHSTSTYGHEK